MLEILERINAESSDIGLMVELFATLRPKRAHDGATATANVRTLCQLLKGNPAHALALHHYARNLLAAATPACTPRSACCPTTASSPNCAPASPTASCRRRWATTT
jgi:hypothetical protein